MRNLDKFNKFNTNEYKFVVAAGYGKVNKVIEYLKMGIDPSYDNNRALLYAASFGSLPVVNILLSDNRTSITNNVVRDVFGNNRINIIKRLFQDPRMIEIIIGLHIFELHLTKESFDLLLEFMKLNGMDLSTNGDYLLNMAINLNHLKGLNNLFNTNNFNFNFNNINTIKTLNQILNNREMIIAFLKKRPNFLSGTDFLSNKIFRLLNKYKNNKYKSNTLIDYKENLNKFLDLSEIAFYYGNLQKHERFKDLFNFYKTLQRKQIRQFNRTKLPSDINRHITSFINPLISFGKKNKKSLKKKLNKKSMKKKLNKKSMKKKLNKKSLKKKSMKKK